MDSSIILAVIAVAAVISPVLTALLNNIHALKMKKLENRQKMYENDYLRRLDTFEHYLVALQRKVHNSNDYAAHAEYTEWYMKALLCVPPSVREEMEDVHTTLLKKGLSETGYRQTELATSLANELERKLKLLTQCKHKARTTTCSSPQGQPKA